MDTNQVFIQLFLKNCIRNQDVAVGVLIAVIVLLLLGSLICQSKENYVYILACVLYVYVSISERSYIKLNMNSYLHLQIQSITT